jgi:filamentous hemagglutinin family protein
MQFTNLGSIELRISWVTIASLGIIFSCKSVQAQVIGDRTTNTQVKVKNNISQILGGIESGDNLFHSFKQFSLDTNTVANFEHGLNINNIFSRVTGGSISEIDGLIKTQGNANLFLINPAGIIFGANAQLNVGGSFIATTAEQIIFADGVEFSAVNPEKEAILTITSPIGLQYGEAGKIAVLPNANRGKNNPAVGLSIQPNNTLALLGGDVSITRNSLNAIASQIEISSIKSGIIDLEPSDYGWHFNYHQVGEYGRIDLNNRALINSSGIVNFQGKTIDFSSSSGIRNFTDVTGTGGIIKLNASEAVSLDSSFLFTQVGQISSNIEQAIAGAGGDILIKAPQIFLTDGSIISAGTLSQGAGGNITLEAWKSIELSSPIDNKPSIISTSTVGIGDGGQIKVNTAQLAIDDGSQIQALAGKGAGGTITVNASKSIDLSGTGILRSQNSSGDLTETILSSGFTASSGIEGLPFALQPQGESGNLIINTPKLTIDDSAHISVSNYGLADAGDIEITTANLNLNRAGEITANTVSGEGGSIKIIADNLITLDQQSAISTTAEQDGDGGNIFLATDNLLLFKSNTINADAQQGSGGNITINTQGFFIDPDSAITASSQIKTKAGTIKIVTLDLNSRLHMSPTEYSPLVAEDYISTGCGSEKDFTQNRFQNIGRGGIPNNPTQETLTLDTLTDLAAHHQSLSVKPSDHLSSVAQDSTTQDQPILEADTWKINAQGKVELIAQQNTSDSISSTSCQF